jgi:HPt (histidine-containing phosphotransfer) domain-containing protein
MADKIEIVIDPDLQELIPGFLENRRRDAARLDALLADRAYGDIRLIGHSMKGAGGGYGFDAVTEIGAELEQAALREDAAAVRAGIARLVDYLARVEVVFDT